VPPISAPADDETRQHMTHPVTRRPAESHSPLHDPAAPHRRLVEEEHGAATAEYAIATMAAVGFAGLLVVIMRSDEIRGILTDLVRNALTFVG
jgi:Flp pilus assembly pilin Flp